MVRRAVWCAFLLGMIVMMGRAAAPPETQAAPLPKGMRLVVAHPSLDTDGLYTCMLQTPAELKINDMLGFGLVLVDRQGKIVGRVPLHEDVVDKKRIVEFRVNKELVKKSYVVFQVTEDPNAPVMVKACPGDEKTVRREGDRIIREPIE